MWIAVLLLSNINLYHFRVQAGLILLYGYFVPIKDDLMVHKQTGTQALISYFLSDSESCPTFEWTQCRTIREF